MSLLRDLRARLGPPPRTLEVRLPPQPEWAKADPLGKTWALAPRIAAQGTLVLGWVVMANAKLWQPGEHDHPAGAVYSFDDACADPPTLLEPASSRLYAMYKDAPEPVGPSRRPWTRAVQDQIHSGFERPFHQPLPPDLTGGPVMYHTSLMVFRDHLPDGILRSSVLPLLVDRDGSGLPLMVPHEHWPDSLKRFMQRH